MKLCKCGCGLEVKEFDSRGRVIKFIKGHNNKGTYNPMYSRRKPRNVCKCGCNKEVKNNRNLYFPGHYNGCRKQNGMYKPELHEVKRLCKCGCGIVVYNSRNKYCKGHYSGEGIQNSKSTYVGIYSRKNKNEIM